MLLLADANGSRQPGEQCWAHEALSEFTRLQDQFKNARARLCWVHTGAAQNASQQQTCDKLLRDVSIIPKALGAI